MLQEAQREALECLTHARWGLNPEVPIGMIWSHEAGPSDPDIGPDTTIPRFFINPADLTEVLAAVVGVTVPDPAEG